MEKRGYLFSLGSLYFSLFFFVWPMEFNSEFQYFSFAWASALASLLASRRAGWAMLGAIPALGHLGELLNRQFFVKRKFIEFIIGKQTYAIQEYCKKQINLN